MQSIMQFKHAVKNAIHNNTYFLIIWHHESDMQQNSKHSIQIIWHY